MQIRERDEGGTIHTPALEGMEEVSHHLQDNCPRCRVSNVTVFQSYGDSVKGEVTLYLCERAVKALLGLGSA